MNIIRQNGNVTLYKYSPDGYIFRFRVDIKDWRFGFETVRTLIDTEDFDTAIESFEECVELVAEYS